MPQHGEPLLVETARRLARARHVVVFTGAGISAESGIDTFRDHGGLWTRFPPERFANLPGLMATYARDPRDLAAFVRAFVEPVARARPNAAHRSVAELQQVARCTVVTQNVDGLHQDAGSVEVLEVHGSLFRIVDARGTLVRTLTRANLVDVVDQLAAAEGREDVPRAQVESAVHQLLGFGREGLRWRPDLVLFGEGLAQPAWNVGVAAAAACDVMLVVGTSAQVMPAAMLPTVAASAGAWVVGVGPQREGSLPWLTGAAGTVLPALLNEARRGLAD